MCYSVTLNGQRGFDEPPPDPALFFAHKNLKPSFRIIAARSNPWITDTQSHQEWVLLHCADKETIHDRISMGIPGTF